MCIIHHHLGVWLARAIFLTGHLSQFSRQPLLPERSNNDLADPLRHFCAMSNITRGPATTSKAKPGGYWSNWILLDSRGPKVAWTGLCDFHPALPPTYQDLTSSKSAKVCDWQQLQRGPVKQHCIFHLPWHSVPMHISLLKFEVHIYAWVFSGLCSLASTRSCPHATN